MTETPETTGPKKWKQPLLIGVAFLLFFAIRFALPVGDAPDGHTPDDVRVGLAILALAAVLWLTEALPLALTALLVPVVASLTGALDVEAGFSGFAHPLIFLFLGGFGLAAALSHQGLDRWIAQRILRLGRGRFHPTAIALFLVSAGLSMWISNTATAALLLPVALGLLSDLGASRDKRATDRIALYLLLGIAYSASIGGIGTLVGTPPNAIAAAQLDIDFAGWLRFGLPAVALLLPCLFVLLRLVVRPGRVPDFTVKAERFEFGPRRKATLAVFALAVVGWLFSARLAAWFGVSGGFDTLVAIGALLLLAMGRLVTWEEIRRTVDWGVLLLFGGGITLSRVLGETGASAYLAGGIQRLASDWPVFLLVGAVVVFAIFLTELSSNTASAALLVPIFAAVAADLGLPATRVVIPLALAASCAFMLPVATPPNAIIFGSGKIRQRDMMRVGLVLNLVFALLLTVLGVLMF